MNWLAFYAMETCARFILIGYYHAAYDLNLDGVLNVIDLQLWANAFLGV